ncbi:hypothetical protein HMI56_002113 [Coelomomyces lativittatus]|nr:hypothetical protein HMI56_002113 [Coelomomyces lativittatus]
MHTTRESVAMVLGSDVANDLFAIAIVDDKEQRVQCFVQSLNVNLTTRGYFQDLVVSFEPWLRSTHGSSTFVSCGLFHQPTCGNAVAVLGGGLGGGPMSFESHPSSFTSHGTLPMTSFASSSTTHSSTFQTSWLWSTTSTHRALEPTSVWQETHSQSQG